MNLGKIVIGYMTYLRNRSKKNRQKRKLICDVVGASTNN